MMDQLLAVCLLCVTASLAAGQETQPAQLQSPDGKLAVRIYVTADGMPAYSVDWQGRPLVGESRLGLKLDKMPDWTAMQIASQTQPAPHDSTWRPVCGENAQIRDHYKQVTVTLAEKAEPGRQMELTFRAYDEGIAFNYCLPAQKGMEQVTVLGENSEFRFASDYGCWTTTAAQGSYTRVRLTHIPRGTERPLLIEAGPDCFVALAEAALVNYSRMKFAPLPDQGTGVVSLIGGRVTGKLPLTTPWRVIMVAPSAAKLLENNFIVPNLNAPCAIADTSWIKPGKALREMTLTTNGAKRAVDCCAAHHIQYMMFDAGWYGQEESPGSDARAVKLDPARSKGPLDLPGVIRYAAGRNIGIILYVNYLAMTRQLKEILPLYHQWGVKGVKYGFVDVGGEGPTNFVNGAIQLAAENQLMVDIHDEWRPTGLSRTWPNLMTCEGIRGDEEGKRTNSQSLIMQYARFIAGPADNTVCYFDPRVDRLCDHAYQLAKSVCFFSPWQFIYWYDRPAPADQSGPVTAPNVIGDEPELTFFDDLPTSWDETRIIDGAIGYFSVIARRSGDRWFIGCMNADVPRTVRINLDFLNPDRRWEAIIYTNDPDLATRTHVKIERKPVDAGTALNAEVGKDSGEAIEIVPVR